MERDIVRKRKSEKKNPSNINEFKLEKKVENDFNLNLFFKNAKAENDVTVDGLCLHETKYDLLGHHEGEFEKIGDLINGEDVRKTQIRFRNFNEHEAVMNAMAMEYISEDSIFTNVLYKLNTPVFDSLIRLIDINMVKELISNTTLLNIREMFATYQRKYIVS